MPLYAWLSLLVFLVAPAGCGVVLATRALRTWRAFKRFSRQTGEAGDAVMRSAATAEEKATSLSDNSERFAAATARLQESLAYFASLRAALAETQALVARLRGLVPTK